MKTEQRKKEDRELIYDLLSFFDSIESYTFNDVKTNFDFFIKDRSLEAKPKLELNRWIVDVNSEFMMFYDSNNLSLYGVNFKGEWVYDGEESFNSLVREVSLCGEKTKYRYATDEEILERLSKIAVEMGYKERQSECLWQLSSQEEIDLSSCIFELGSEGDLWIIDDNYIKGYKASNCIFKDGKWAKFIETDTERIERLEKRIKELENKNK